MDWKKWLKGLVSAVIGAASGAIGMMIVDPMDYNIDDLPKLGKAMLVFAIIAAGNYLKKAPVPSDMPKITDMRK